MIAEVVALLRRASGRWDKAGSASTMLMGLLVHPASCRAFSEYMGVFWTIPVAKAMIPVRPMRARMRMADWTRERRRMRQFVRGGEEEEELSMGRAGEGEEKEGRGEDKAEEVAERAEESGGRR